MFFLYFMQTNLSLSMCPVVSWRCINGSGRRDRLFLLLPGGKELTHHGVLQEPRTSGKTTTQHTCAPRT